MTTSSTIIPQHDTQQESNQDTQIPPAFGAPNGTTIENKDTIFDEIDKALGMNKPPDVEVILTDHLAYTANPISRFLHKHILRFGHIAIRYTTSDGVQRVMNILGDLDDETASMINFVHPPDYFYGTKGWNTYAQQGGVYNRPFVGVRIENVDQGATDALHAYYQALDKASAIGGGVNGTALGRPGSPHRGAVRFQLVEVQLSKMARMAPSPLDKMLVRTADFFRNAHEHSNKETRRATTSSALPVSSSHTGMQEEMTKSMADVRQAIYNSGNCAQWTSSGLDFCGLIRRPRLFPKSILVDLLEEELLKFQRPHNVHVVYYDEVAHAHKRDPDYQFIKPAMVSPIKPIRNVFYHDLKKLADARVKVEPGSKKATVERLERPQRIPGQWLQVVTGITIWVPAAVMVGLVQEVGPIGPTAAAVWLFANWWLY